MKTSKRMVAYLGLVACLCLVGFVLPVGGQAPAAGQAPAGGQGILGYLNPRTGTFKPLIRPTMIENLENPLVASVPATTGTFVVNFTITVKSSIPSTDVISCEVEASTMDLTTQHTALETAAVAATRSGSSAKCTVTIPYSWILTTPTTDMVSLEYIINTPVITTTSTSLLPSRMSMQTISNFLVPASGTTSTFNVAPVI